MNVSSAKHTDMLQVKSKNELVWCHFKQNLAKAKIMEKFIPIGEHSKYYFEAVNFFRSVQMLHDLKGSYI